MKFYLIVAKGSRKGMPIPVAADLFMIGSDKMCQLRSRRLPPEHCALIVREKKVYVRDMNSGESTLVNGAAIPLGSEWPLHAGDRLEIGALEFMVQFNEKGLSQKDLEEWAASLLDQDSERIMDDPSFLDQQPTNAAEAAASIFEHMNAEKGEIVGRLRIGMEKGVTVVRINDTKLVDDSEIAFVKKEMCDNLNRPNLRILLDFKNLQRVSTAGVMMIREFYHWLKPWGSSMAICRIRQDLRDVLTSFSQDKILLFADKKEAIATKW